MEWGSLSKYFHGIGYKCLTATEVDPSVSHGHEFQGIRRFREILGADDREFGNSLAFYFEDAIEEPDVASFKMTWYDSRRNAPHRSAEYRLYYDVALNPIIEKACPGDLIVIAKKKDESMVVLICKAGSSAEARIRFLFGINGDAQGRLFNVRNIDEADSNLDSFGFSLLEMLGIAGDSDLASDDEVLSKFATFPSTGEFSEYARSRAGETDPVSEPDATLMLWLDTEEWLFRTLERKVVAERIEMGFLSPDGTTDVDGFISFSLSVQNRRKSRAGRALENHLAEIFRKCKIPFDTQQITENKAKPDFIFPGIAEYRDETFDPNNLYMLGAKTTCKDRWRQVLSEAERIERKHLLTLEPGISSYQTDEMKAHKLSLVVPESIHPSYATDQREWLLSLRDFIELLPKQK